MCGVSSRGIGIGIPTHLPGCDRLLNQPICLQYFLYVMLQASPNDMAAERADGKGENAEGYVVRMAQEHPDFSVELLLFPLGRTPAPLIFLGSPFGHAVAASILLTVLGILTVLFLTTMEQTILSALSILRRWR